MDGLVGHGERSYDVANLEPEPAGAPTAEEKSLSVAIDDAGFRVGPDITGRPTLWCKTCGRDSGLHHAHCKKSKP